MLTPVTKFGFAVGSGSGKSSGREAGREGTGGGGGSGVEPIALIAVFKNIPGPEGVQVIPLLALNKKPPLVSGEEGLNALRVCEAAIFG